MRLSLPLTWLITLTAHICVHNKCHSIVEQFSRLILCDCVFHCSLKFICPWGLSWRWHPRVISLDLTWVPEMWVCLYVYCDGIPPVYTETVSRWLLLWSMDQLWWFILLTTHVSGPLDLSWHMTVLAYQQKAETWVMLLHSIFDLWRIKDSPKNWFELHALNLCMCQFTYWGWTFVLNPTIKIIF
jgi:hypothetical protein